MKPITDLETLIRRLAGRDDPEGVTQATPKEGGEWHLDDPSSDASRFLDEIRRKTRSLFDESTTPRPNSIHPQAMGMDLLFGSNSKSPKWQPVRSGWLIIGIGLMTSLMGFAGLAWSFADGWAARHSTNQTDLILKEIRSRFPGPLGPPLAQAVDAGHPPAHNSIELRRLEVELASLNAKIDGMSRTINLGVFKPTSPQLDVKDGPANLVRPTVPIVDPNSILIGADLAAIRRELVNSEAATTRQIQEMRTVLQEVNAVVRRVLSRPQPSTNPNVALPILAIAVQALTNNLQHPSAQVRGEAIEQLVRLGTAARSAVPALQQMLGRETDPNIRSAIETALTVLSSN